jgi:hypothetical protein
MLCAGFSKPSRWTPIKDSYIMYTSKRGWAGVIDVSEIRNNTRKSISASIGIWDNNNIGKRDISASISDLIYITRKKVDIGEL